MSELRKIPKQLHQLPGTKAEISATKIVLIAGKAARIPSCKCKVTIKAKICDIQGTSLRQFKQQLIGILTRFTRLNRTEATQWVEDLEL